jgi:hypothetical protein
MFKKVIITLTWFNIIITITEYIFTDFLLAKYFQCISVTVPQLKARFSHVGQKLPIQVFPSAWSEMSIEVFIKRAKKYTCICSPWPSTCVYLGFLPAELTNPTTHFWSSQVCMWTMLLTLSVQNYMYVVRVCSNGTVFMTSLMKISQLIKS